MKLLENREEFLRLDMQSRETLMRNSSFGAMLYRYAGTETGYEDKMWDKIRVIRHSMKLTEDPFYQNALPDYNWSRHIVFCYIYLLTTNIGETGSNLAKELVTYCDKLDEYGRTKPEVFYSIFPASFFDVLTRYTRYKAGVISKEDYLEHLNQLWLEADLEAFNKAGGDNVVTVSAYIETAMDGRLTEQIKKNIRDMYSSVTLYAFRIPKLNWISSILGMYSDFFLGFQELPGGMEFEEFGLKMLAAFHPPTYIHSNTVAKGHHLWYDGSAGYPLAFEKEKSPYRTVIDIVACADCMDAATDVVGRSYNKGKSLEEYISEVAAGSGTRYAPYLAELLREPLLKKELDFLLKEGRESVYQETYKLLRMLQTEDIRA